MAKLDDFRPVLVVGASGQLGTRIVQQLAAAQRPVRAFVRPTSQQAHLRLPGVELVQGDLGDVASIDAACRGAGAVIATANAVAPAWQHLRFSGRPWLCAAHRNLRAQRLWPLRVDLGASDGA